MKIAFDENLPPALAHAVHALLAPWGGQAISIPERFGRSTSDRDWITALHQDGGWAVLTADRKIRSRPHERRALEQSGLVIFLLAPGLHKENYWAKAAAIIRWLPAMMVAYAKASSHIALPLNVSSALSPPVLAALLTHFGANAVLGVAILCSCSALAILLILSRRRPPYLAVR